MKTKSILTNSIVLCLFFLTVHNLRGEEQSNPSERGYEIAKAMDLKDDGYQDEVAELTMTLRNRSGDESKRRLHWKSLEIRNDGDWSIVVFREPKDLNGTAFLTYAHALRPDDQWLYLPSIGRVKRVISASKSGPFMGSEFAYEDLSATILENYKYTYLGEVKANGVLCLKLERIPQYEHTGYSKQVVYVDKTNAVPIQIEFYDRKGTHLKTLTYSHYSIHHNRFFRAAELKMENHQTGKSTIIQFTKREFQKGLGQRDFDVNSLHKVQ